MPNNMTNTPVLKVAQDTTKVGSWAEDQSIDSGLTSAVVTPEQKINLDQNREPQPPKKGRATQSPTPVQRWLQQGTESEPFVVKHTQKVPVKQLEASHKQQPCRERSPTSSTEALKDPESPSPLTEGI
jgi:hypothetical protein